MNKFQIFVQKLTGSVFRKIDEESETDLRGSVSRSGSGLGSGLGSRSGSGLGSGLGSRSRSGSGSGLGSGVQGPGSRNKTRNIQASKTKKYFIIIFYIFNVFFFQKSYSADNQSGDSKKLLNALN